MSIFDSLFGKSEGNVAAHTESVGAPPVPNRPLNFDPDLIPRLTQEHLALARLFGEIKQSHSARNFAALERALQKFQLTLNLHLATENTEFYGYLYKNLRKNTTEHDTLSTSWAEMQEMGNAVSEFLAKHNTPEFTAEMHAAFGLQLEGIGAALMKRIKYEEEKLYCLYAPA